MTKPRPDSELATVRRHARRLERATARISTERDYWIRRAYEVGASTRAIAAAAELSHQRVAQIIRASGHESGTTSDGR